MKKAIFLSMIFILQLFLLTTLNSQENNEAESKALPKLVNDDLTLNLPYENENGYNYEEIIIVKMLNDLRKDKNVNPLLLNTATLLSEAQNLLSENNSESSDNKSEGDTTTEIEATRIKISTRPQPNYKEDVIHQIEKQVFTYRKITNSDFNACSVKIKQNPQNKFYDIAIVLGKIKDENSNYSIGEWEFRCLLEHFRSNIRYQLSKVKAIRSMKRFVERNEYRGFYYELSSTFMIIYHKDTYAPYNYVQFGISYFNPTHPVVFNKTYFFKQENVDEALKMISDKYSKENVIKFPKEEKVERNYQARYYLVYNKLKNTEKEKKLYTIAGFSIEDELVEVRWFGERGRNKGIFLNTLQLGYGLHYVNDNLGMYNLKKPMEKDEYLYLLDNFLDKTANFQIVEFLKRNEYILKLYKYLKLKREEGIIYDIEQNFSKKQDENKS